MARVRGLTKVFDGVAPFDYLDWFNPKCLGFFVIRERNKKRQLDLSNQPRVYRWGLIMLKICTFKIWSRLNEQQPPRITG